MSWKILIVMFIVLALYIYSYYRYPKNTLIIQSHIRMFKPELLLDKQPIIVDDNDIDIIDFKTKLFSMNPTQQFTLSNSDKWYKNKHKYLILQSKNGPCDILLCNPNYVDNKTNTPIIYENDGNNENDGNETPEIIEVQLSEGQIVIIPFNWIYYIQNSSVECISIHDYVTYFLP